MASLTPEDQRKLKELGLESAYLPCGSGGAVKEAAECSRARCEDELPELVAEAADEAALHGTVMAMPQELGRRVSISMPHWMAAAWESMGFMEGEEVRVTVPMRGTPWPRHRPCCCRTVLITI